jgi:hypothetical protein
MDGAVLVILLILRDASCALTSFCFCWNSLGPGARERIEFGETPRAASLMERCHKAQASRPVAGVGPSIRYIKCAAARLLQSPGSIWTPSEFNTIDTKWYWPTVKSRSINCCVL